MIISHKYKFIFIKTLKTAGTSIEVFLSPHCGEEDILTPIQPHVSPHVARNHAGFAAHMPAFHARERVPPEVWDGYFKFCVERNPWDKTLSHFHMLRHRSGGRLSLQEFLSSPNSPFPINFPLYMDPGGNVIVDRVLRYENLTNELDEVFRMLGIPFSGSLGVNAKSEYRTDRRPYQEVFTSEQAEFIRRVYAVEIQLHGYTFEPSA